MQSSLVVSLVILASLVGSTQAGPIKSCSVDGLLERINITRQSINLHVIDGESSYSAMIEMSIKVKDNNKVEPKNVIAVHAGEEIEDLQSTLRDGDTMGDIRIIDTCRDKARQLLVITFREDLKDGFFGYLRFDCTGSLRKDGKGVYSHEPTKDDNSVVKTNFSDSNARLVVPCFDDSKYKTPFEVDIVTSEHSIATSSSLNLMDRFMIYMADPPVLANEFNATQSICVGQVSFEVRPEEK